MVVFDTAHRNANPTEEADMSFRTWSAQQEAIFTWFSSVTPRHLVVRARAGTGKTTTIIEGINRAPERSIRLCAFNKRIAEELSTRITNPNAQAKTLHSMGFEAVRRYWEGVRVASGDERAVGLTEQVCQPITRRTPDGRTYTTPVPDVIKKLVTKLHTKGREIAPHATKLGELTDIAYNFECEPDEEWVADGFDLAFIETKTLQAMDLAARVKPVGGIDFADMIFLPVRNHWLRKSFDLVVVDEAQDMTVAQLEIARGVCRGRICVVGDDRQAIYGFRGADSDSLDRLKSELNAEELGLTTTYRCGQVIVQMAATLVPDFQAGPQNPAGSIDGLHISKLLEAATPGDFVLSRTNAPLVSVAMGLLRSGKRARIAGRDIGAGLKALIRRLSKGRAANSVPELLNRIALWETRETERMKRANRLNRIDGIHDQAETLISLAEGAASVRAVEERIDALFTDDGLGQAGLVTCSSVHRAKGLEANRVFILWDTVRDKNQEELNIQYVAITRAKTALVLVSEK